MHEIELTQDTPLNRLLSDGDVSRVEAIDHVLPFQDSTSVWATTLLSLGLPTAVQALALRQDTA